MSAQLGASALLFVVTSGRSTVRGRADAWRSSVPAPAFIAGVETFFLHGSTGHPTFLLGTPSNRGWWYYFPVALAVKTPIPLLLLSIVGARGRRART